MDVLGSKKKKIVCSLCVDKNRCEIPVKRSENRINNRKMGNVLASSKADLLPPAPAPSADPLPIDTADPTKSVAGSLLQGYTIDELENPGSMEELHKRCKGKHGIVQQRFLDGGVSI